MSSAPTHAKGLEGVIAGETEICNVEQSSLIYRGYEIADLAENASFEEVAYLLIEGEKPTAQQLEAFDQELVNDRKLPDFVCDFLRSSGELVNNQSAVPMDILRSAVSMLGHFDSDCQDNSNESNKRKSKRLLAQIPTIIGHMQNSIEGRDFITPTENLSHSANLLYMMTGEHPTPEAEKVMDVSMVLYAEHDYNASTFTARVIAGTLADMHGAVSGAIAALKGKLHGGANEAAMDMLADIRSDIGPENNFSDVQSWMHKAFEEKRKLMGFGHRVYKNGDHRAPILHGLGRKAAEASGDEYGKLFELGEMVQRIMEEEKNIFPNVDFPCGMTYYTMGIPVPQYTPIFVASRITGWCAHIIEQHGNNRLIRPRVAYIGAPLREWNA
jgi:2-methylcitrate synthase